MTIDARGKVVVPGLIDIHSHAARVKDGPALCLADGVTGFVDAGSQGADRIQESLPIAKAAPQPCRVLVNIGRAGILPDGDTMDLSRADVGAARDAIAKNRDMIVGIKARLSRDVAGPNDYEVLRRAQEVVVAVQSARDDPHGADDLAAAEAHGPAQARRYRDTYVRAAAEQHRRRVRPHPAGGAGGPAPRRLVRSRQWTHRPSQMGHRRARDAGGLLARHVLYRLDA